MSRSLLDRRLLFVTGKGGVGKSTVAAALASLAASTGRRTLVCEVDDRGDLADFFEAARPGFRPKEVQPGVWAMVMQTEESLQEYLQLQLHLPALGRLGPLARMLDFVATAAPGVREILTVGKLAWEVREAHYDLVIVDAPSSGHVVGLLTAPKAINELVKVGVVRQQSGWVAELLADPSITGLVAVTTPEEMPVSETIELLARVRTETEVDVAAVVVNQVLPELFSRSDEDVFEQLRDEPSAGVLVSAVGPSVATVLEGARLAVSLRRMRAAHLDHLRAAVGPEMAMLYVPYLFVRSHGRRTTAQVADALMAEMGE
ncbi:MAG: ArsA family ATPase [Acidimicrobiales bacterium]